MTAPVQPPHQPETMKWNLQEGVDLQVRTATVRGPGRKRGDFRPDLLEIAAGSLRGAAKPWALDVIDPVVAGQPPRDMVAGGAVLGEPIISEVEKNVSCDDGSTGAVPFHLLRSSDPVGNRCEAQAGSADRFNDTRYDVDSVSQRYHASI